MCKKPLNIPHPRTHYPYITVPCGKCSECLKAKTNSWYTRLHEEYLNSYRTYMITLTYDDEHVPHNMFGDNVVCKRDIQLFFKRLRKNVNGCIKFKYFLCSEYGPKTARPHYHCLLFITSVNDDYFGGDWYSDKYILDIHVNNAVFKAWGNCAPHCFKCNPVRNDNGATRYIAKYMTYGKFLPKCLFEKAKSLYISRFNESLDSKLFKSFVHNNFPPCFLMCSNHLGVSLVNHLLNNFKHNIHLLFQNDSKELVDALTLFTINGFKFRIPKYVLNKLFKTVFTDDFADTVRTEFNAICKKYYKFTSTSKDFILSDMDSLVYETSSYALYKSKSLL